MSASASEGPRLGLLSRSTTTWLGAATQTPRFCDMRSTTTSSNEAVTAPCDHAGGHIGYLSQHGYYSRMKTVAATEAKNRFGAIIDDAQREPVVIRRQDRDVAVVLSMADYQRLRSGNAQAFLDLRNAVAAEAAAAGLTDDKLDEILRADRA